VNRVLKIIITSGVVLIILGTLAYHVPVPFKITQSWVLNNQSYFFQHTAEHYNRTHVLDRIIIAIAELKLKHDFKNIIKKQTGPLIDSDQSAVKVVVGKMKDIIITQRELPHWATYQSQFASLVRGYGACDQINGNAAYILNDYLEDVFLLALVDQQAGIETHTTIKTISSLGTVYVDAWSNIPYFGFKEELTEKGKRIFPKYEEIKASDITLSERIDFPGGIGSSEELAFSKNSYEHGRIIKGYSSFYFFKTLVNRFPELFARSTKNILSEKQIPADPPDLLLTSQMGSANRKKACLKGRLYHLHGKLKEASEQYRKTFESDCHALFCSAAKIFYQRLQKSFLPEKNKKSLA